MLGLSATLVPEDFNSFVGDKIMVKTAHPILTKIVHKLDVVSCYFQAWDEEFSSELGVTVLQTELHLLGSEEVVSKF